MGGEPALEPDSEFVDEDRSTEPGQDDGDGEEDLVLHNVYSFGDGGINL